MKTTSSNSRCSQVRVRKSVCPVDLDILGLCKRPQVWSASGLRVMTHSARTNLPSSDGRAGLGLDPQVLLVRFGSLKTQPDSNNGSFSPPSRWIAASTTSLPVIEPLRAAASRYHTKSVSTQKLWDVRGCSSALFSDFLFFLFL